MANHQILFGRPLMADEVLPALSVTGVLGEYTPEEAYDSELDINNSVGRCTLTVVESTLPPGHRVFIDQLRKKVVVRWDAYTPPIETTRLVPNGDFEAGDDGQWLLGNGWVIGTGEDFPVQDGTHSLRFKDYKGTSDCVLTDVPAKVNDRIKITATIQHGASSSGNVGARVSLIWRDKGGRELQRDWGNYISSGSKGAWKESSAEGYGPGEVATVQAVISAKRSRQNHGLFVDKVMWDHSYVVGQNGDDLYYLHVRVRDSLNREAEWRGYIEEAANVWISQLYPVHHRDLASVRGPAPYVLGIAEAPDLKPEALGMVAAPTVIRFALRNVIVETPAVSSSGSVQAPVATKFGLREVIRSTSAEDRGQVTAPRPFRFGVRPEPVFSNTTNGAVHAPTVTRFSIA